VASDAPSPISAGGGGARAARLRLGPIIVSFRSSFEHRIGERGDARVDAAPVADNAPKIAVVRGGRRLTPTGAGDPMRRLASSVAPRQNHIP
jgi:hypothetical protein